MLHLVLRKYKEVYDENFAGCQWRIEVGYQLQSNKNYIPLRMLMDLVQSMFVNMKIRFEVWL